MFIEALECPWETSIPNWLYCIPHVPAIIHGGVACVIATCNCPTSHHNEVSVDYDLCTCTGIGEVNCVFGSALL